VERQRHGGCHVGVLTHKHTLAMYAELNLFDGAGKRERLGMRMDGTGESHDAVLLLDGFKIVIL
jgi:hypothetical protein